MKNYLCHAVATILLVSLSSELNGQNLVVNPSFEDTVACPVQIGLNNNVADWTSCAVTPDYFNSCANNGNRIFGVPFNNRGFQPAHSGNAYIGLFTFSVFATNMREFVGSRLAQPLTIGQRYFVTFWVAHPDTAVLGFASNRIGVKFTTVQHSPIFPDTVGNFAHVFSPTVITDTVNWTMIEGSFVADSAYTFIEIGNFFDDASTTLTNLTSGSPNYAYYFVDDVCVTADPNNCSLLLQSKDQSVAGMKIYSAPAQNKIFIKATRDEKMHVRIFNLRSELVYEKVYFDNTVEIDSEMFSTGLYFVSVTSDNQSQTQKVAVIR